LTSIQTKKKLRLTKANRQLKREKTNKGKKTIINTIQEKNDQNFEDILDKAQWLAQKT